MRRNSLSQIEQIAAESGATRFAVAACGLGAAAPILREENEVFHAGSTMKTCVMAEVFRQAVQCQISLDDKITVHNRFESLVDGSPFEIDANDDSDSELFELLEHEVTIRELVRRMIVRSSNLATNLLLRVVQPRRVTAFMEQLGAAGITVLRGVEDGKAYRQGLNNTTTALGMMRLYQRLLAREVVSADASNEMIRILLAQEHNEGIPAGLLPGTPVAHKTGWTSRIYHDAGIVFPPGRDPYVLVVLTEGLANDSAGPLSVAKISRTVFELA